MDELPGLAKDREIHELRMRIKSALHSLETDCAWQLHSESTKRATATLRGEPRTAWEEPPAPAQEGTI